MSTFKSALTSYPVVAVPYSAPQATFTYSQKTISSGGTSFTYYTGTIATATDLRGHATNFYYDPSVMTALNKVVDPCSITTSIGYTNGTAGSGTTSVTDSNLHTSTQYYVGGVLDHVVDATGATTASYTYDSNNNVSTMYDGRHLLWQYFYDSTGTNRTSVKDPDLNTTNTIYNALNEPTSVQDALTHTTTMGYDSSGNMTSITDPLSHTSTVTVPAGTYGLPSNAKDALLNTTTFASYDSNGNLTSVTDPNGTSVTVSFNALNWKQSQTDALGNTTVWSYDNWGRVLTVKRGGAQQQPFYRLDGATGCINSGGMADDLNRIYTADSAFQNSLLAGGWQSEGTVGYIYLSSGAVTGLVALHRLQSGASGGQSAYSATSAGVSSFVSGGWTDEGTIGYVYPATVSATMGLTPLYQAYNPTTGRYLFTTEYWDYTNLTSPWTKQGVICYLQGQAGSLQTVATYTYDLDSNVTAFQDANGNGFSAYYDADNRLTSRTNTRGHSGPGTINDTVTYTYDQPNPTTGNFQQGLLSWMTNGNGGQTTYTYDNLNRVIKTQLPDGATGQITAFDGNGNVKAVVDGNGHETDFNYDNENRLLGKVFPSPSGNPALSYNKSFTYYADGRLKTMNDYLGTTNWYYDAAGRVTSVGSPTGTVGYGYDNANRLTTRTASGVSGSWTFTYGIYYGASSGTRLVSETSPFGERTISNYDAAGRLFLRTLGNNVYENYSYDDQSRVTDINYYPNTATQVPFDSEHYTYDADGRLVSQRHGSDGQFRTFTYDGANQLVEENTKYKGSSLWYDEQFTYDHNSNRLTRNINGSTDTYSYDAGDKLTDVSGGSLGTRHFSYDGNGALIHTTLSGNPLCDLVWDWDGRLVVYAPYVNNGSGWTTDPGAGSVWTSGLYNGFGLRQQKTDGTGTFHYQTDGLTPGSPVLSDGAAVYTDGLSEHRSGVSSFYSADITGSIDNITDASGSNVTYVAGYDSFGVKNSYGGSTSMPFGYGGRAGYQTDASSGLMLLGNRFYDSGTGRFISRDPIGDGDNWYAYCANNPVSASDPTGLGWEVYDFQWDDGTGVGHAKVRWTPDKGTATKYSLGLPTEGFGGNAMRFSGSSNHTFGIGSGRGGINPWVDHVERVHYWQDPRMTTEDFYYTLGGAVVGTALSLLTDGAAFGAIDEAPAEIALGKFNVWEGTNSVESLQPFTDWVSENIGRPVTNFNDWTIEGSESDTILNQMSSASRIHVTIQADFPPSFWYSRFVCGLFYDAHP